MIGPEFATMIRALVSQGRYQEARALAQAHGRTALLELDRAEFIAITDLLSMVDQAAEAQEEQAVVMVPPAGSSGTAT
jgi:hypothetical protein